VYGFYGQSALIGRNHLTGFNAGIRAAAINNITAGQASLWRVSDNFANSAPCVDRTLRIDDAGFVEVVGNKP
jgi:hypothetical protein